MATIYVDTSRGTNGSGSFASPRNVAPTAVAYGDIVLFKEGVPAAYWVVPAPTGVGSDTNRVTIGTYDAATGAQLVDPSFARMAEIRGDGTHDSILIQSDWVTVIGVALTEFRNFPNAGARAVGASHVTVQGCRIAAGSTATGGAYGIRFDNPTGSGAPRTDWKIIGNKITRVSGNAGIICVWSATSGEYATDITICGNDISGLIKAASATAQAILVLGRGVGGVFYTDKAGLKGKGVQILDNVIRDNPSYAIEVDAVAAGGSQRNLIARNQCYNIGDGNTDVHCISLKACDDVDVEENYVDGSNAWVGQTVGTGVGIFVDMPTNVNDGCTNINVRRNVIRNTGRNSVLNDEVGGAAIMVFMSQNVVVESNVCDSCANGIVVIGWYGSGNKSQNVKVRDNIATNSTRSNYYVCHAADLVDMKNNIGYGGQRGFYIENAGGVYPITNYTETANLSYGATMNWAGGDEPAAGTPTITARTPAASNLTTDPLFVDPTRPWLGLQPGSPCQSAGVHIQGARDRFGRRYLNPPHIGPWATLPRA